jgi:hypothetical protein
MLLDLIENNADIIYFSCWNFRKSEAIGKTNRNTSNEIKKQGNLQHKLFNLPNSIEILRLQNSTGCLKTSYKHGLVVCVKTFHIFAICSESCSGSTYPWNTEMRHSKKYSVLFLDFQLLIKSVVRFDLR